MADINTQQMAQILIGIARAQFAIVEAIDGINPGFKSTHFSPTLQTAARIREFNRQATLTDFPVRVLMDYMRRTGPDAAQVQKDLEALLGATAPGGESLDMTSK